MLLIVWLILMVMVMMMMVRMAMMVMVMMVMAMMMMHETDWADGTCGESDALGTARPFPFHHRWTVLPFVEVVLVLVLCWCCFHLPLSWIRNQPLATSPNIEPCATTSYLQITWKLSLTVSSCLGTQPHFRRMKNLTKYYVGCVMLFCIAFKGNGSQKWKKKNGIFHWWKLLTLGDCW